MTAAVAPAACPVCRAPAPTAFAEVADRRYWRCPACLATFLEPTQRPERAAEYAHYLHHENDDTDPAYRRFAARLAEPLLDRLPVPARVLDFGAGPSSALAALLREAGHEVALYDPFFAPDPAPLAEIHDAVALCEVAEHLFDPAGTFAALAARLRPGGWLAIMTCFQTDDARFPGWWYRRDPTHVVFYREATLRALAARLGWSCEVPRKDVALLRRPPS